MKAVIENNMKLAVLVYSFNYPQDRLHIIQLAQT